MRIILISILSLLLVSCTDKEKLPVEILGSKRGTLFTNDSGKRIFKATEELNVKAEEGAVWYAYIRTNKEKISYVEEIKMNGPTRWNIENSDKLNDSKTISLVISEDKTSAIVTREVTNSKNGLIFGSWKFYEDEPMGPISVKVTIEGRNLITFNWMLKNE